MDTELQAWQAAPVQEIPQLWRKSDSKGFLSPKLLNPLRWGQAFKPHPPPKDRWLAQLGHSGLADLVIASGIGKRTAVTWID